MKEKEWVNFCKKCGKPFEPKVGYKNYCSNVCKIKKPVCGWNRGIKGSTGDHKGEKNSYHLMTDESKAKFAKMGNIAGNKKIAENPELYAEKKRKKMNILMSNGYRPQDNAGWKNVHVLTYTDGDGKGLNEATINHLDKILGV